MRPVVLRQLCSSNKRCGTLHFNHNVHRLQLHTKTASNTSVSNNRSSRGTLSKNYQTNAVVENCRHDKVSTKSEESTALNIRDVELPEFTDPKNAYQSRTFLELVRAYMVFRLCSYDALVDRQDKILKILERCMGTTLFRKLMRSTLYGQFLVGDSNAEVVSRAIRERRHGILPMFAYTAAEVHGDIKYSVNAAEITELFKINYEAIHNAIDIAAESAKGTSIRAKATSKLTFLTLPETLRSFNDVIRSNVKFLQDMRNDDAKFQVMMSDTAKILQNAKQDTFIQPDLNVEDITQNMTSWAKNAAFHLALNEARGEEGVALSEDTMQKLSSLCQQLKQLGKHASEVGVHLIWDAEQTYLQDAIDVLVLDSMREHNKQLPVIANTYQCYLKRQLAAVELDLDLASKEKFCLGLKVVRGAYIVEEQRLAKECGYEDPINPSYDATSSMYYSVADTLLGSVTSGQVKTQSTFATHNLDTVIHIVNRMKALNINVDGNQIAFAQLVGMRDHITYPLGSIGLPASKLFHYGPVLEGVAYMSRRVQENRGGIGTANLERQMLGKELRRRITLSG